MKIQTKNDFSIPYLSNKALVDTANSFLAKYNKDNTIPVPIEHITEYELGISIVPTKNLEKIWGIDAFINSELNTIVIDDKTYMGCEERTRFTLAHEIAHKILHEEAYKKLDIKDENSYLKFQDNGNLQMKKSMEFQAYFLAGYLVLPQKLFNPRFNELYDSLKMVTVEEHYAGYV